MKKVINSIIIILGILMLGNAPLKAQFVLKEADLQYSLYNYDKAVVLYTAAYQKKKTLHAVEKLAESYRAMRDYKQAESWYAIEVAMEGAKPEALRWYAEMLRNNSKYSEAKIQYAKYAAMAKDLTTAQTNQVGLWQMSCDSAMKWMKNPTNISVTNERALNSAQADWAAVNDGNAVVFTSDRKNLEAAQVKQGKPFLKFDGSKLPEKKVYGWTGNDYLRVYQQIKGTDSISLFPLQNMTDYHIGATSFSADGNEVFFTMTNIPKKIERVKRSPSTINIEIFSSKKENGVWGNPIPFRYNNAQKWSVGDPFLSQDGTTLYFVSDKPGGRGGTDIYYCRRSTNGNWSEAFSLSAVNTPGNERSPMTDERNFYFATDGSISMGGLDIYRARISNGSLTTFENMGYPINSPQDDFAFNLTNKLGGYFASNREGGVGSDDIYSFIEQEKLTFKLEGTVFNKETNLPLANAIVSMNSKNGSPLKVQTDEMGNFSFNLLDNSAYLITVDKTQFRNVSDSLSTKGLTDSLLLRKVIYLIPIVENKPIRIDNIYYDFDKVDIRADAAKELDQLVAILKENPTIWIELSSHTDSRGNDQYNLRLSQGRANSAVQYIISKGIEKSRITAKGYGESKPVNQCTNGLKCTETDYQLNRRTEFKIVKQ